MTSHLTPTLRANICASFRREAEANASLARSSVAGTKRANDALELSRLYARAAVLLEEDGPKVVYLDEVRHG